jgi:hypothetical protein
MNEPRPNINIKENAYMKSARILAALGVLTSVLALQSCSKSSSGGATLNVPSITPIVKKALPAGLQPGGASGKSDSFYAQTRNVQMLTPTVVYTAIPDVLPSVLPSYNSDQYVLAQDYIANLFQTGFVGMGDGSTVTGYLLDLVEQADGRTAILNTATLAGHPCLSTIATPYTLDLSDISPVLKLTLSNLQCSTAFTSGSVATMLPGAGELFGLSADGTAASVWTSMMMDTGGIADTFFNAAQITNLGSTSITSPESVNGIVVQYNGPIPEPTSTVLPSLTATRYIANSTLHTFEMYYANTGSYLQGIQGGAYTSVLGAGFRMVSDGSYIYADGYLALPQGVMSNSLPSTNTLSSASGNIWIPFAVCMNGTDLSVEPDMSNCATAFSDFTLATTAALNTDQLAGVTTPIHEVPMSGPGITNSQVPGTAVVQEIDAKIPITAPTGIPAF